MSTIRFVAAVAVIATVAVTPASAAVCEVNTSCDTCTGANSGTCGWCTHPDGTGVCLEGKASGPTVGACPAPNNKWHWFRSSC